MVSEHRSTFPRGLVLGLTMAETAILIIFVLLLALTLLLARETDRRQTAEEDLERFKKIQQILAERGLDAEELLRLVRVRVDDQPPADNWRELIRILEGRIPDASPETIGSRLIEAQEIYELLDEAGVTARALRDTISVHKVLVDVLGDSGNEISRQDIVDLITDAKHWRARASGTIVGGSGTDHPSCWYDADKSIAYLFDVALTDGGFVLQAANAPLHRDSRASLPIDDVITGRTLSAEQFLTQTRPVFQWSVRENCRFFVRAFDLTAADQKELYKTRMRTLESHFYKNASPSGSPPFSDSAPPLP